MILLLFQLVLMADDKGIPQQTSESVTLTIKVIRNQNSPRFDKGVYQETMDMTEDVGKLIKQMVAVDEDNRVNIYRLYHSPA